MPETDLVLRSNRVVLPHDVVAAAVLVADRRVVGIVPRDATTAAVADVDLGDRVLLPGLVDTHVHVNEPGRTDWEGFASATQAAAAGGVTTIVDMPLNSRPTTVNAAALAAKQSSARGKCAVDYGFWGGVVPGNHEALASLIEGGARGFKCFLCPAGIDDFEHVAEGDLRRVLPMLAGLDGPGGKSAVLLVHAESPDQLRPSVSATLDANRDPGPAAGRGGQARSYPRYLATRPPEAEIEAIELLIRLCEEYRSPLHIVHLSAAGALPMLRDAKARGLPVSAETCPHYLFFSAEEIADGDTRFKCAPPIRGRLNCEQLWEGLADGTIDLIASDHSPCPPDLKQLDSGDFDAAWGGVASLQLGLPAMWTAARARGHSLVDLARCVF